MNLERPHCTPGLRLYQWMMQKDGKQRLWNQERLRVLRMNHLKEVELFCSHDPLEFEMLSGLSARVPADQILRSA
jgi:hypothetical protein